MTTATLTNASDGSRVALLTDGRKVASLYALTGGVRADELTGTIHDVAVLTLGNAQGHPFIIDATTLQQALVLMQSAPDGVKVRVRHPTPAEMAAGVDNDPTRMIGRLTNPRIVGDSLRADLRLGDYAAKVPGYGDVRGYLLSLAASDPAAFGLSPVIDYEIDPASMAARIRQLIAVDTVGTPAANPAGLLSAHPSPLAPGVSSGSGGPPAPGASGEKGRPSMDPKLIELLRAAGLDPNAATPEQIQSFINEMSDEGYSDLSAKAKSAGLTLPGKAPKAEPVAAPVAAGLSANPVLVAEQTRVSTIRQLAATYGLAEDSVVSEQIVAGADVNAARRALLARLGEKSKPVPGAVHVGADRNLATLGAGVVDAVMLRAGTKVDRVSERAREFEGMRLSGMARAFLNKIGVDTTGLSDAKVAQLSFNKMELMRRGVAMLNLGTGDFPGLLGDAINKRLRVAFDETPSTWNQVFRRNTNPDFKTINVLQLSEAPGLIAVAPGGEYKNGVFNESRETYALQKFGRIIPLNWEAIINDDLSSFSRIPVAMGQAAKRLEDDVAWAVFLSNANLSDGGALFNNTAVTTAGGHANVQSAAAISVASIGTMRTAMRKQVGLNGAVLNLEPRHLIVPTDYETDALQLINSQYDPASNKFQVANPFRTLSIVSEPRLSVGVTLNQGQPNQTTIAGSTTRWYLAADTSAIDTVEVCFLESEPAPVVEEQDGFRIDAREFKVRHTVAAKAIDYRGLQRNG